MRVLPVCLFVVASSGGLGADEKVDFASDLKRLQGVWETDAKATTKIRFEVKGRGIGLRAKGQGFDTTLQDFTKEAFELVEKGGKATVLLDEKLAKLFDLPRVLNYRFDKDTLILTATEGDLKGEHKLTKTPTKK